MWTLFFSLRFFIHSSAAHTWMDPEGLPQGTSAACSQHAGSGQLGACGQERPSGNEGAENALLYHWWLRGVIGCLVAVVIGFLVARACLL